MFTEACEADPCQQFVIPTWQCHNYLKSNEHGLFGRVTHETQYSAEECVSQGIVVHNWGKKQDMYHHTTIIFIASMAATTDVRPTPEATSKTCLPLKMSL
ncbi:hypothetical protein E2C01_029350 [Portunus trituberculatus]|uniref:Uncharacterized protein n=1 Tax=Portunus trituberculatus TaxID=210409 RepID=A0A5B7ESN6_PORTR|nr:hypothetical protein [Portunus trituberculatus]